MLAHVARVVVDGRGFNPHPAEWPGDAYVFGLDGTGTSVSIRTRPNGRVMRRGRAMSARVHKFQSAPGRMAG